MANALGRRRAVDTRDFHGHAAPRDALARAFRALEAAKDRHAESQEAAASAARVVIDEPRGISAYLVHTERDPSIKFVAPTASGVRFSPGQRATAIETLDGVTIVGPPVTGDQGKSRSQPQTGSSAIDGLQLVEVSPNPINANVPTAVQLIGVGFKQSPLDIVRAERWNATTEVWDLDTRVTLADLTWVSATELTAQVTTTEAMFVTFFFDRS